MTMLDTACLTYINMHRHVKGYPVYKNRNDTMPYCWHSCGSVKWINFQVFCPWISECCQQKIWKPSVLQCPADSEEKHPPRISTGRTVCVSGIHVTKLKQKWQKNHFLSSEKLNAHAQHCWGHPYIQVIRSITFHSNTVLWCASSFIWIILLKPL